MLPILFTVMATYALLRLEQYDTYLGERIGLTVTQAADIQIRLRDLTNEVRLLSSKYEAAASLQSSVNLSHWTGGFRKIWEPEGLPIGVIILHQGHSSFAGNDMHGHRYPTLDLVPAAKKFASAGYRVYGMEMPPLPHSDGPVERFYRPVIDLIDAIGETDLPVFMVGLSGGGWTTTVATALEDRIAMGFSVAGDAPGDIAPIVDCTDWEQCNPPHDYRTLYAMAGERLVHIYNFGEPGPWSGLQGDLGYEYVNDMSATEHTLTDWTVEYILNRIASLAPHAK